MAIIPRNIFRDELVLSQRAGHKGSQHPLSRGLSNQQANLQRSTQGIKRTVRFNTEQIGQLVQCPDILNLIRCIEIENINDPRRPATTLNSMMDTLSAAGTTKKVFLGISAFGGKRYLRGCWISANTSPTTASRMLTEVYEVFSGWFEGPPVPLPKVYFVDFEKRGNERVERIA